MARDRERNARGHGLRVVLSALLLVGVLIGLSYGSTAWERARDNQSDFWTEITRAFAQVEVPLISSNLDAAKPTSTVGSIQSVGNAEPEPTAPPLQPTQSPQPAATPAAPKAVLAAEPTQTLPMLVNAQNHVPDDYKPDDLVLMRSYCPSDIVTIKGSEIEGQREAVDALLAMLTQAKADGLSDWQVSAGYRSVQYQQSVFDDRVYTFRKENDMSREQAVAAAKRYVAEPGASEHHTGLAFDITVPGESFRLTPQCQWLTDHCWDYGFIIRYTEEKEAITGIAAEPWHIRYVGLPHAQIMRDNNWCLEEYIQANP